MPLQELHLLCKSSFSLGPEGVGRGWRRNIMLSGPLPGASLSDASVIRVLVFSRFWVMGARTPEFTQRGSLEDSITATRSGSCSMTRGPRGLPAPT